MSGIYIPGIETSGTCVFCRFCDGIADTQLGTCAYCVVDGKAREADTTPKDCPLIPVPEHGRLIEEKAIKNKIANHILDTEYAWGWNAAMKQCYEAVEDAPTIIPADGNLYDSLKRGLEQAINGESRSETIPAEEGEE